MIDEERETEEASKYATLPDPVVCGVINLSTGSPTCDPKYRVSDAPQTNILRAGKIMCQLSCLIPRSYGSEAKNK